MSSKGIVSVPYSRGRKIHLKIVFRVASISSLERQNAYALDEKGVF